MINLLRTVGNMLLRTEPEQDNRPEVAYKPFSHINLGQQAAVYDSQRELVITDVVIAYDMTTESFETRRVRYVLDKSYEH